MLVSQYKLDVVGVCETWLNINISDNELSVPGFRVFNREIRRGEIREGKGGGVILYVRETLSASVCNTLTGAG